VIRNRIRYLASFVALCTIAAGHAATVFVEAESFTDTGGWVVDQQYMDQMGSPVLLAHGMGEPVADATTRVTFPATGTYRVWVRTWNWNSPWDTTLAPGRFRLAVDGHEAGHVFGTRGDAWHWHPGGEIAIRRTEVDLTLHDLTGFNGRCDAVVFSDDAGFVPPEDGPQLLNWRRQQLGLPETPPDAGEYDLVVVGGGLAGTCAAVSAARLGLSVALIQNRPVLGGNNSSESRVHAGGRVNLPPYPALGNLVREVEPDKRGNAQPASYYDDGRKLAIVQGEDNIDLFLNTHADGVDVDNGQIMAVLATNIRTGRRLRFPAKLFADCTGDGTIGFRAGADFRMGRESRDQTGESLAPEQADAMTMGASVMWYAAQADAPTPFPQCPWALAFDEKTVQRDKRGDWNWETGMDLNQVDDFERVRDQGLRAVYGNWAFLKNHPSTRNEYAKLKLGWVAYVAGKRESRRLLGDVILTQQDIEEAKPYPDACVTTTWSIDLHYPHPTNLKQFPDHSFRSVAKHLRVKPYAIPYRCLYSRNIGNLLMAGRDISVTHVALGTIRVMRTTGMMGEVVGMAAAVCARHSCGPREVYAHYLDELKAIMTTGTGRAPTPVTPQPPKWLPRAGRNVAREATVTVSSNYAGSVSYPPKHLNDGLTDVSDNNLRWVSGDTLPHTIELAWDTPQTVNAVRLLSGWRQGTDIADPITDFVVQTHDGQDWRDVPETKATGNTGFDWHAVFKPVTVDRIRLLITNAPGNRARLWELEFYNVPSPE